MIEGKVININTRLTSNTGLHELQSKLRDAFPNLNTVLVANGERLLFKQFYKTGIKAS